jgi:asparagine synthase (glutamine-hydrolysing)
MCGILGLFDRKAEAIDFKAFEKSLGYLKHRGPDNEGVFRCENGVLGHRRLSIIDLSSEANQPFTLPGNDKLVITFNGEIYNYKDLAKGLTSVKTESDTEIILRGYSEKGVDFFKSLRGIYAFAIFDQRTENKVILYRDPAGVKPLYYFFSGNRFIFSSELKAITPLAIEPLTINNEVIKTYLSIGYCPEPYTIYKEIRALEPGQVLELDVNSFTTRLSRVNQYSFEENHSVQIDVGHLLQQAVRRNIVADVPILFSLSGGIDSSLVVAYAKRCGILPNTLTVSFDDGIYDESGVVEIFTRSLELNSDFVKCDVDESLPLLNRLLLHFDQPYADSSLVPFYFLSKVASQRSRVLIGGDGGDEIQAGYSNFRSLPWINKLRPFNFALAPLEYIADNDRKRLLKKTRILLRTRSEEELLFLRESWVYPSMQLSGALPFTFNSRDSLELYHSCFSHIKAQNFETKLAVDVFYKRMLGDYLRKSDMMSMYNSLEYRVPMLDEDLVANSLMIPTSKKTDALQGKKLFRKLHSQIYPKKTTQMSKRGFSIPLDSWLKKEEFEEIRKELLNNGIVLDFVERKYLDALFGSLHQKETSSQISRAGVYQQILIFYSLQLWYNGTLNR